MDYIQGSTYQLTWTLYEDKCKHKIIDNDLIQSVDFAIGNIRKNYPDDVQYDIQSQSYIINLSAEETFNLPLNRITRQARVRFKNQQIKSTTEQYEYVHSSKFKEVSNGECY